MKQKNPGMTGMTCPLYDNLHMQISISRSLFSCIFYFITCKAGLKAIKEYFKLIVLMLK